MADTTDITSGDIATASKEASAEASPAPASQKPTATADASPTASPAASEPTKDAYGPIPWERHELILNNTRREYDGKLGKLSWAERLDRSKVERALQLADLYEQRPDALAEQLAARTKKAAMPGADARDERGEAFYSPQQAAALARYEVQQAIADLRNEWGERLAPIETEHAQTQRHAALVQEIQAVSTLPGYLDHLDAMTAFVADMNQRRANGEPIPVFTAEQVYNRVVPQKLATARDALIADEKKKWLDELENTSAAARADINPNRIPAGTHAAKPKEITSALIAEEFDRARKRA